MGTINVQQNTKIQYGITRPISVAEPSPSEVIRTKKLKKFLVESGLYESKDQELKRQEILGRLDEIVKLWSKKVCRAKGFSEEIVNDAYAKIFTFGSYRLGVHGPGTDIDTLCVGPSYATREHDFFGELHNMLEKMPEVKELHPIPDAYVPVLKFKFDGISIDLLYAKLDLWGIKEDSLDLSRDTIFKNVDEQTARSLNGSRVTDKILSLVPNVQNFLPSLRSIRYWAKQRAIYSNVTGFLGGINLAILVARICQVYPKALPSTIVSKFFRVYSQWKWPIPIMLCELKEGDHSLPVWNPRKNPRDQYHLMPIITPAYPSMNSSYNVSASTLRIMQEEFSRGHRICEEMEMSGTTNWDSLFEPLSFFEAHTHYLQIDVAAADEVDFMNWKGWVESRLRRLTQKIENHTHRMLQCHPYPREIAIESKKLRSSYYFGLQKLKTEPKQEEGGGRGSSLFDLTMANQEFQYEVGKYNLMKPGMSVSLRVFKRQDLPAYVFPGGVRPPRPAKRKPDGGLLKEDGTTVLFKKRITIDLSSNLSPSSSSSLSKSPSSSPEATENPIIKSEQHDMKQLLVVDPVTAAKPNDNQSCSNDSKTEELEELEAEFPWTKSATPSPPKPVIRFHFTTLPMRPASNHT